MDSEGSRRLVLQRWYLECGPASPTRDSASAIFGASVLQEKICSPKSTWIEIVKITARPRIANIMPDPQAFNSRLAWQLAQSGIAIRLRRSSHTRPALAPFSDPNLVILDDPEVADKWFLIQQRNNSSSQPNKSRDAL